MTFKELSTDLTGRYVSFKVNPLSFSEALEITNTNDYKNYCLIFLNGESLPQRFSFKEDITKLNYISDVYDSIVLKDVVEIGSKRYYFI